MSSRLVRPTTLAWASAWVLAATLAACGGGGGDGDGPPGTIDLTVANRDTVAHAVVAGAMGLGGADLVISGSGSAAAQRHVAQSLRTAREGKLAVTGPIVEPCAVSGSMSTTFDDRDNDGLPSVGDVLRLQFAGCKDSFEETVNGMVAVTFTQILGNGFRGSLFQDALAVLRQQHSLSLTGTMQMSYTESSPTVATLRLVADGPVVAVVSTPVFADTVTLADGYVQESSFDIGAAPPPGSVAAGRASTTTAGRMSSQAAGGEVTVASVDAIVQYTDDAYPRAGVLVVTGRTGSLRITALSTTDVRLELDTNGDGSTDVTTTQRWDWLV